MKDIINIVIILFFAGIFAYAGSSISISVWGISLYVLCSAIAFVIQWIVFIPSFVYRNEHFFDLTGSLSYLSIVSFGLYHSGKSPVQVVLAVLVLIWALRLGTFLFRRVKQNNGDSRFEKKDQFGWFFTAWTLQGLWVFLTSSTAMTVITTETKTVFTGVSWVGLFLWLIGFGLEVTADRQKTTFRTQPENKGRFIQTGLWKYSRHPNYLGEILLWIGIAIIAIPSLQGLGYLSLISPVFVYILLTRISGIPILEEQGLERWGTEQRYQDYLRRTPCLLPFVGRK